MQKAKTAVSPRSRPRLFYGYTIVSASALILIVMHGINASFGVFFTPLQQEFGWDRAAISAASSISFFLLGFFSTIAGRVTDRFGPRFTLAVCACILAIGYLLMSRIQSIWQLYLFYGMAAAMGGSGGDMSLLPTVARWFTRRRSLMSSVVKVGTGIGIFVMPLVSAWLIMSFNWRTAYVVLAILAFTVIMVFSRFLKRDPAEMGLHPYGESEAAAANQGKPVINLSLRETVRTPQFWLVCGSYFLVWYASQSTMVHIAPRAVDVGFSVAQAATLVSAIGGASILGRLAMGGAGDRIGMRRTLLLCFGILITALTWLQFSSQTWMLYVFTPIYGFAHGGFFAIVSPLVADLFGLKSHGSNLGLIFFIGMIGGAIGPILTGRLFDVTHSYQIAFMIMLGAAVAGVTLASFIRPVKRI